MYKHICISCGKEFNHKEKERKYCSMACYRQSQRTNVIEIKENFAEILINSTKYGNIKVLIDKEDVAKVSKFNWSINPHKNSVFYISTNLYNGHPNKLYLHRFITNCPSQLCVDHINHNTLDNRKSNLKICTTAGNNNNLSLSKASKSGQKYICFDKNNKKYVVSIKGKFYGRFTNIEDAIRTRDNLIDCKTFNESMLAHA